jgi:hypothetical protein
LDAFSQSEHQGLTVLAKHENFSRSETQLLASTIRFLKWGEGFLVRRNAA